LKTSVEIDEEALATAVNAAFREVGQRLVRLRALARLGDMADSGDIRDIYNPL